MANAVLPAVNAQAAAAAAVAQQVLSQTQIVNVAFVHRGPFTIQPAIHVSKVVERALPGTRRHLNVWRPAPMFQIRIVIQIFRLVVNVNAIRAFITVLHQMAETAAVLLVRHVPLLLLPAVAGQHALPAIAGQQHVVCR
jgi:hypothetical protein